MFVILLSRYDGLHILLFRNIFILALCEKVSCINYSRPIYILHVFVLYFQDVLVFLIDQLQGLGSPDSHNYKRYYYLLEVCLPSEQFSAIEISNYKIVIISSDESLFEGSAFLK